MAEATKTLSRIPLAAHQSWRYSHSYGFPNTPPSASSITRGQRNHDRRKLNNRKPNTAKAIAELIISLQGERISDRERG